jgi:hypothetical protein
MQSFQELRFADVALRLLRDVTRLVRPSRDSRQILLATPPNDPNPLGLAVLELLLFTEGINCLTLGAGVPAQEVGGAARAYEVCLVALLFDRGMSGKIAGRRFARCAVNCRKNYRCSSAAEPSTCWLNPFRMFTPLRISARLWL